MIFIGGIKSIIRQDLAKRLESIDKNTKIRILCSGKFTIESILLELGFKNIIGGDVSLLSCIVGSYIMGEELDLRFKGEFESFNDRLKDDNSALNKCALVLFIYAYGNLKNSFIDTIKKKNMLANMETIISKNKEGLEKNYNRLKGKVTFKRQDLIKSLSEAEEGELIIADIPTITGGYETLYKMIDECVEWEAPQYEVINDERYTEINDNLLKSKNKVIAITNRDLKNDFLKSKYKIGCGLWYLYSNINFNLTYMQDKAKTPFFNLKTISEQELNNLNDEAKIEVFKCLNYDNIRKRFKSKKLAFYGAFNLAFLVHINGKAVGGFAYRISPTRDSIFLLSDFTFINKRKISKLIPMVARGKEAMSYAELALKVCMDGKDLKTFVFTNAPVSMKYRGIYNLTNRKDDGLLYTTKCKERTIKEEFKIWLDKYYKERG